MYKLKDGFSCVRNKTLTGEKIIVGIKDTKHRCTRGTNKIK